MNVRVASDVMGRALAWEIARAAVVGVWVRRRIVDGCGC